MYSNKWSHFKLLIWASSDQSTQCTVCIQKSLRFQSFRLPLFVNDLLPEFPCI